MSDNNPTNPFSELLSTPNQNGPAEIISVIEPRAEMLENNNSVTADIQSASTDAEYTDKINTLVENVFFITLNKDATLKSYDGSTNLVFLEELATSMYPQTFIDLETLEQALFERLLMTEPSSSVIPPGSRKFSEHVVEKKVISYLYNSYQNLHSYSNSKEDAAIATVKGLIFRNAVTALKQPDLFDGQNLTDQLLELLQEIDKSALRFVDDLVNEFMSDGDSDATSQLKGIFIPIIRHLTAKVNSSSLISLDLYVLPAVQMFAGNRHLSLILLDTCAPTYKNGIAYQETLFGALLALSPLPRLPTMQHQFFDNPLDQGSVSMTEQSLWTGIKHLVDSLNQVFLTLLRGGGATRKGILKWIGGCLRANVARGKLWNVQADGLNRSSLTCVSDGFMINLGAVLLRLSQPFCSPYNNPKSLKIDPTYCAVQESEAEAKSVNMPFLHEETCILPPLEDGSGNVLPRPTASSYTFVTECFFMTQKCLDLGYRVLVEKLSRLSQDLSRMDRALQDAEASGARSDLVEVMHGRMRNDLTMLTSLRCVLLEPSSLVMLEQLYAASCAWLVQVALHALPDTNAGARDSFAPTNEIAVGFPITTSPPDTLRCIPEFIIENIVRYVSFSRRMSASGILNNSVSSGATHLSPLLTMVVVFMGSAERMRNPHLRAGLAECLESMLPTLPDEIGHSNSLNLIYRERLFKEHPHRMEIARSLLDVFVGIEMTGQSVQFEQKFNYRRPMYLVMDYLWEIEEHKQCFIRLAEEAEANMEAVQPPIFLRFVNLLINDAIFLLDEALSNMSLIRKLQAEREAGAWEALAGSERSLRGATLQQTAQLARFDNILGRDTARALRRVALTASSLLARPSLAPRVAAMLNYFLYQLVGPNRSSFKVRDSKEYEFDPASTVMDICDMYVALGNSDEFCQAVSDDGRSYSPQLFTSAEEVLARIGGGAAIGELRRVAMRVCALAAARRREEEALSEAPEPFLDPIMSTLMADPVILPSSRTTVDRSTIARHLLSDQSDPFNRSPLTMDQVIPDTELKQKIEAWIVQRKQTRSSINNSVSEQQNNATTNEPVDQTNENQNNQNS